MLVEPLIAVVKVEFSIADELMLIDEAKVFNLGKLPPVLELDALVDAVSGIVEVFAVNAPRSKLCDVEVG